VSGFEYEAAPIAVLGVAVVAAYFLKGFSGFGPALIFMPVAGVSIVMPPAPGVSSRVIVPASVLITFFSGAAGSPGASPPWGRWPGP